jgi:putative ABC transport system permease protein
MVNGEWLRDRSGYRDPVAFLHFCIPAFTIHHSTFNIPVSVSLPEILGQFWADLKNQRMRTILTVAGITWGTVAVVVLLAFGSGLQTQMQTNARGIGDGLVIVFPGTTTQPWQGFTPGRPIRLVESDAALLGREVPEIRDISPEFTRGDTPVTLDTLSTRPGISGVHAEFGDIRNIFAQPGGRFLNTVDLEARRRVVFLGDSIKARLFGETEAVGREILIRGTPFTVIGVMQPKTQNSSYGSRDQDRIFIPATTFAALFGPRHISNLVYRPASPEQSEMVNARVREVLGQRYTFDPADHSAIGMWDTGEGLKFFHYLFLGFNLFLGVVGSFTLIVGGIGVANIMYVVVRERTREIGIRRAIGARRRDILGQVFAESFFIVAIGAAFGFAISVAIVRIAALFPIQEQVGTPVLSPTVLLATLALLAVVALLAGLFPARRAANLDPVESLRYGV